MKHICIVDDEPIMLMLLDRILTREGYAVEAVFNSAKADELLASRQYDLVITDLCMAGISGEDLIRTARRIDSPNQATPILVLSGSRETEGALRLGANQVLAKPAENIEILLAVTSLLGCPTV